MLSLKGSSQVLVCQWRWIIRLTNTKADQFRLRFLKPEMTHWTRFIVLIHQDVVLAVNAPVSSVMDILLKWPARSYEVRL